MRAYLDGVAEGLAAAPRMAALFVGHAERLEQELAALRVRQAYAAAKAALWRARADGDQAAGQEAAAEVLETMRQLRGHDRETRPSTGSPRVSHVLLDLADLESVARAAASWSGPLHILVCNAGVMAVPELTRTGQGHERSRRQAGRGSSV